MVNMPEVRVYCHLRSVLNGVPWKRKDFMRRILSLILPLKVPPAGDDVDRAVWMDVFSPDERGSRLKRKDRSSLFHKESGR